MSMFLTILKWIAHIVMALVLVVGLFGSFGMSFAGGMIPTGPEDLGVVRVTVKSVVPASTTLAIGAEEYPTQFVSQTKSLPEDAKNLVQVGQKVDLSVKKEAIDNLKLTPILPYYKLTLADGRLVFDESRTIPEISANTWGIVGSVFHWLIGVPVVYFALVAIVWFVRGRRANGLQSA